jgi:tetratricopeptide (TPR) repeat protein
MKFVTTIVFAAASVGLGASTPYEDVLRRSEVLVSQGNVRSALELLLEATREYTAGAEAARIRHEIGAASERVGDEPHAISSYWSAVKLADAAGRAADSTQLASLWNLGTIFVKSDQPDRLKPVLDQYWRLRTVMDRSDPTRIAYSVRFAVLCQSAHKYRDAEALFLEGISLLRASPDKSALASALAGLGSLYISWSHHSQAIACGQEALELGRDLPAEWVTRVEVNLSTSYLETGDVSRAASTLDDVAACIQAGETSVETRRRFYWNSAKLCRMTHRRHDARTYMSMWKNLDAETTGQNVAGSIDVSEMSGRKGRH